MPTADDGIDSEQSAADHLYGLEPARFVAARDLLVGSLRQTGNRSLANTVKGWRRPSALAGELNRLLRSNSDRLRLLIEAADDLRRAQQRALAGETVDLHGLLAGHRQAAAAIAEDASRDHEQIQAALERASLDEGHHEQLRAAAYTVEPQPTSGFDLLIPTSPTPTSPTPTSPTPTSRAREAADTTSDDEVEDQAGDQVEVGDPSPFELARQAQIEAERRRAEVDVEVCERRLAAARESAATAVGRVAEQEQRLAAARRHRDDADQRVVAAESALASAERRLGDNTLPPHDQSVPADQAGTDADSKRRPPT